MSEAVHTTTTDAEEVLVGPPITERPNGADDHDVHQLHLVPMDDLGADMNILGIDLGIRKAAVGFVQDTALRWTDAYQVTPGMRPQELMDVADWVYSVAKDTNVGLVFIEVPIIGNNRKYSMQIAQMYGAVLYTLALMQTEQPLDVVGVDNKQWKKGLIGNGNVDKHGIRDYVDQLDPAYSVLCGGDQDRYDAAAIGLYGWQLHSTAQQLMEDL